MIVADHAATSLQPIDIHLVRDVTGDPDQEDHYHPDGERKAQIDVRILRPLRPFGKRFEANEWQEQRTAEGNVQSRDRQNDETGRGQPVHEALERREAHDGTPRATALEPDHAPAEIEDHEHS